MKNKPFNVFRPLAACFVLLSAICTYNLIQNYNRSNRLYENIRKEYNELDKLLSREEMNKIFKLIGNNKRELLRQYLSETHLNENQAQKIFCRLCSEEIIIKKRQRNDSIEQKDFYIRWGFVTIFMGMFFCIASIIYRERYGDYYFKR